MALTPLTLAPLTALSPLDGRYFKKVASLSDTFSEFGLIRLRLRVELEWLKALGRETAIAEVPAFSPSAMEELERVAATFCLEDAEQVKAIETRTNHDVKALEYWIKERLASNT
ncbi:MAG: adenylosuccinate lyase, partial [Betaproteobacteria bacterium]